MKEKEKKEYGEATLDLHRKIRKAIDNLVEDDVPCVLVSAIEREVGKDPRTVKFHLKLLQEAGYGKVSKDGKLFCPKKPEEK